MAKYATRNDIAQMRGQRMDPWFSDKKYVRKEEITGFSGMNCYLIQNRPNNSLVPTDKISYTQPLGKLIMQSSMGEYGSLTSGAYATSGLPDFYEEWDSSNHLGSIYRESDTAYTVSCTQYSTWSDAVTPGQYVVITDFMDDEMMYKFWNYKITGYDIMQLDAGNNVTVNVEYKIVPVD